MSARYRVKRTLLAPRTVLRRRRYRAAPRLAQTMLEQHAYSTSMLRFMGAVAANPDLLTDADLRPESIVVDAGAYVGEWAERIIERYGARLWAFEPNPVAFEKLRARLASRPGVTLAPYGLGFRDDRVPLALAGPASSVVPGAVADAASEQVEIPIRDVAVVFEEVGLDHIDVLKVNIEGSEYDLFERLIATGWLERIELVSVQFHEWIPRAHRRRRAIRRALSKTHSEVWCYPWVWELWQRRGSSGLR